jgi:folate-binding protein YgfZ
MIEILKDRALVNIVGPDSGKFLQGMTTNDVIKKEYSYNYLLTNQGKYLFDFFVYQKDIESYFIDINKTSLDIFLKRLNIYKLRSNVDIKDVSLDYNIIYSKVQIESDVEFSLHDTRYKDLGYRSMVKIEKLRHLDKIVDNIYILDKYKYSIIDGYLDLVYERSIPIEYGAEELNAIDYNKGCYVGQEVISRVKYQGVVRKKIFKLQFGTEFALKNQESKITNLDGDKLGMVCSNYKNQAIGILKEEKFLELKQKIVMVENQLVDIEIPPWRI